MRKIFAAALLSMFVLASCSIIPNASKRKYNPMVKFTGVGCWLSSGETMPEPRIWYRAMDRMEKSFPGTDPIMIWTVGKVNQMNGGITLGFPSGTKQPLVISSSNDNYQRHLRYFDLKGIPVLLRIEPGMVPVEALIEIVLSQYTNHPCVAGIGIDAKWHLNSLNSGTGKAVSDELAKSWEKKVKSFNTNYRLFIEQNEPDLQPKSYRGDIIFVCGISSFRSVQDMAVKLTAYSDRFYPSLVIFRVGMPGDKSWWSKFKKPQERIGDAISEKVRQEFGILWTDQTMKDGLLK